MFRKLLTLLLLIPLSLNGLWITCAQAEDVVPLTPAEPAPAKAVAAEAEPVCAGATMCPLHKAASEHEAKQATGQETGQATQNDEQIVAQSHAEQTGAICLISPDGKSNSIAAIGFVYAPPATIVNFGTPEKILLEGPATSSHVYLDALSPGDTPPPRA